MIRESSDGWRDLGWANGWEEGGEEYRIYHEIYEKGYKVTMQSLCPSGSRDEFVCEEAKVRWRCDGS